ncbi:MAG TPA: hypothetical protein VGH80_02725 [Xanthomonadaceae bacterium]|jgi:hypothetical protein
MPLIFAGLLVMSASASTPQPANQAHSVGGQSTASTTNATVERPSSQQQDARAAYDAAMRALGVGLRNSASPRDRALVAYIGSAYLIESRPSTSAERMANGAVLRAAAEAAPGDGYVQSLWMADKPEYSGCNSRTPCPDRSKALIHAEPDNALAWLPAVEDAKDEAATDAALARMAQATTYDDHLGDAQKAWMDAFARYPLPAPRTAEAAKYTPLATVYEVANDLTKDTSASFAHPSFGGINTDCDRRRNPAASPQRFRDCAQIGRTILAHSGSLLGYMFGRDLLRISGQATPADIEMARIYRWQIDNWFQPRLGMLEDPEEVNAIADDWGHADNEIEVMRIELTRAGIALVPPRGWWPHSGRGPYNPLGEDADHAAPKTR